MLEHEDDVEEHTEDRETELGDVESSREGGAGIAVDGVDDELEQGEGASGEVEDDVEDRPAVGALTGIVPVHLGHVLDERDEQFHVSHHGHWTGRLVHVGHLCLGQVVVHEDECPHAEVEHVAGEVELVLAPLVVEGLAPLEHDDEEGVVAEDQVLDGHFPGGGVVPEVSG